MTNPLFSKEWLMLEKSTLYYRNLLQNLPLTTLMHKPTPEKWSLLEIMEHLAGAEGSALKYLEHKQYKPLKSSSLLPASFRAWLLHMALRSPLKFKAPKIEALNPSNKVDPKGLLQDWRSVRQGYYEYLEQVPEAVVNQPLFRHPRAGALNLHQMLQFMSDHLEHHKPQAEAILIAQKSI